MKGRSFALNSFNGFNHINDIANRLFAVLIVIVACFATLALAAEAPKPAAPAAALSPKPPKIPKVVSGSRIDICAEQPDATFFKDFSDCKRYIACVGGRSMFGSCPDQLLFNSTRSTCDYSQQVHCNSCPRTGSKTIAMEGSCRRYVRCSGGTADYLECPNDLFYDPKRESCNLQSEVECTERTCQKSGSYMVANKEDCAA